MGLQYPAMTDDSKRKALVCLATVAILAALVAIASPRLEFKPGVPLPALAEGTAGTAAGPIFSGTTISLDELGKAVISLFILAFLIFNGYQFLRRVSWNWRDAVRSITSILLPILVAGFILLVLFAGMRTTEAAPSEAAPPTPAPAQPGPPLGPVPAGLIWMAGLVLAGAMTGLGLWLFFRPDRRTVSDPLTLHAERALQALKNGLDLKNAIVRCYWEMQRMLKEEQGIAMKTDMTVREFERLLTERGLPPRPVRQLTRLFETVRYGHQEASAEEERLAVDSLTAIARYNRTKKQPYSP